MKWIFVLGMLFVAACDTNIVPPLRAYGHAARVEFAGKGGDPLP